MGAGRPRGYRKADTKVHNPTTNEDLIARRRIVAWFALALTTAVLLAPGAAVQLALSLLEPVLDTIRHWKNSWWPSSDQGSGGLALDKIIHFVLFALCAVFVIRAWHTTFHVTTILFFLLLFGVFTEIVQYFIPGRSMSLGDMIADSIGTLAGMALWRWFLPNKSATTV